MGQPPERTAGPSGFKLVYGNGRTGFDPITQRVLVAATMRSMSGPLPSGAEFALYEKAVPGTGDRMVRIVEQEQAGRLSENQWRLRLDEMMVKGHNWRAGFAQPAAVLLVLAAFSVSHDLTMHGHDAAGIALGTTTIASILAAFLGAKFIQPKDEKNTPDSAG